MPETGAAVWGESEPVGQPVALSEPRVDMNDEEAAVAVPVPGDGHGIIPASELLSKPRSRFVAAVTVLNRRLLSRLGGGPPHTVLITGSGSVADKVSIAAAVATLNAADGRRVVIVDLSRGEAELHRAFAMPPRPGVADVLAKSVGLTKAFQTDFRTHVTLLARGEHLDGRLANKLVDATPSLLTLLTRYFDLVVVVVRNLDAVTEAELVLDRVDLAVVVETRSPAVSSLRRFGEKLLRVRIRH